MYCDVIAVVYAFTSAKNMLLPRFVCLRVCPLAGLIRKLCLNFRGIFLEPNDFRATNVFYIWKYSRSGSGFRNLFSLSLTLPL